MFYSDKLLGSAGALGRVWIAANLERKLSKTHILQSDIEKDVQTIVNPGQAPMALRLSSQLLLGVVRIYGRKARYLMDDCNDALGKIKMAYKIAKNSNDLPEGGAMAETTIPVQTTEPIEFLDNIDLDKFLSQPLNIGNNDGLKDFGMDWSSSLLPDTQTQSSAERPRLEEDIGLDLDLGDDLGIGNDTSISIEAGRNAPAPRPMGEDLFAEQDKLLEGEDLGLDLGGDIDMNDEPTFDAPPANDDFDQVVGMDDMGLVGADETALEPAANQQTANERVRNSHSPLSEAPSEVARDLDRTFAEPEDEEEVAARQPQRSKKRKLLVPDTETVLHNHQIKEQQNDRSKILRPVNFLPSDPLLLTLMNMQKNGDFVSNIMGDGRSRGWAPELRGILSIDVVRKSGELKRKRDSGIADMDLDDPQQKSPRLDLDGEDELEGLDEGIAMGGDSTLDRTQMEIPEDGMPPLMSDGPVPRGMSEGEGIDVQYDAFEDTTAPLVHPADNGPVSLGTKHAVHLLRDRFGTSGVDGSPASQRKANVLFQDLLPEQQTSKEDATKMFFEVLVLATKDAIKVEQSDKKIGEPLRIRGKRGLWGSWAETEAGGEIEHGVGVEPTASAA